MRTPCIVFDLDDTLYLERDYVRSGLEAVGSGLAGLLGVRDFAERAWALFEAGRRESIFQTALSECGAIVDAEIIAEMLHTYRNHNPNITLLEDSVRCIRNLQAKVELGLITDGDPSRQRLKCSSLGVGGWFPHTVYTGDFGEGFCKPHPRAFESIQHKLGAGNYRFVYVGDNPAKDFAAPLALGWDTVRIRRPGSLHYKSEAPAQCQPRFEVSDLWKLPDLFL